MHNVQIIALIVDVLTIQNTVLLMRVLAVEIAVIMFLTARIA